MLVFVWCACVFGRIGMCEGERACVCVCVHVCVSVCVCVCTCAVKQKKNNKSQMANELEFIRYQFTVLLRSGSNPLSLFCTQASHRIWRANSFPVHLTILRVWRIRCYVKWIRLVCI
jgi:hypothetical protein